MALERVLQGKRVHDSGKHADVVGLGALHAFGARSHAAEDVSSPDDNGQLDAVFDDIFDLNSQVLDDLRIDAVPRIARQGLAGQF